MGTETILLVEDNESVRALAFQALTRRGYRVLEAANGEEGIRIATELGGAIDLVITDVVMPVMGGRELSTRLLAMWPGMKILFTSGYTDDTILKDAAMEPGIVVHPEAIHPGLPAAGRARHARPGRRVALTARRVRARQALLPCGESAGQCAMRLTTPPSTSASGWEVTNARSSKPRTIALTLPISSLVTTQ